MQTLRVTYTELLLLRRLCKTIGIDANDLDFMVMPSDFGFKRSETEDLDHLYTKILNAIEDGKL